MSEREKSSLLEVIMRTIAQRALGVFTKYIDRQIKRILRVAGFYAAGLAVALIGLVFLAVGVVKWLTTIMPSWLAWLIVGIIMILLGIVCALAAFLASRS